MEKGFQLRHVIGQETAVLADAVAAHGRHARFHVLLQKRDGLGLCGRVIHHAGFHPGHQPGIVMVGGIPFVHAIQ